MKLIDLIILFAISSGLLIFFVLIGHFVFSFFKSSNKGKITGKNVGYEILFGFFVTIVIYSFIKAGYRTINILFLELALLYLFAYRKSFSIKSIEIKSFIPKIKHFLPYLLVLFLFSLFQWIKEYDGGYIHLYWRDYNYYVSVAETFNSFNKEAGNLWYSLFNEGSLIFKNPYHYFDIWVNSFLLNFSNIPSIFIYIFQFIPLVAVLSSVSFSLIFTDIFKLKHFQSVLVASLMIVLVGVIPLKAGGFSSNVFFYPKFLAAFVLFPMIVIFLYKKDYLLSVLIACLTVILHPVYLLTVFGALGLFFLYNFINERNKKYMYLLLIMIGFVVSYFLFYYLFGEAKPSGFSFDNYFSKEYFAYFFKKIFIDYLVRLPFYYFSVSIAFVILLISKRFYILKSIPIIVFILISILGIIFSAGIINRESFAIVTSVLNTSLLIVVSFILGEIYNSLKEKKHLFGNFVIIVAIFVQVIFSWIYTYNNTQFKENTVSKSFFTEIKDNKLSEIGCYFVAPDRFLNSQFGNPHVPIIGGINHLIQRNTYLVSLSVFNKRNNVNIQKIIINTPFYKFVEKQKINEQFESIKKSQIDFIKKYHINYAVFEKGCPYPECLKSFEHKNYIDSLSGITFVYLYNN